MHVNIISSMDRHNQSGGAALQCHVFNYIYKQLNLGTTHSYQNIITQFHTTKSIVQRLYFRKKIDLIFKNATIELDTLGLRYLDHLRHFHGDLRNHKPTRIFLNTHNMEYENYFNRPSTLILKHFQEFKLNKW